MSPPATLQQDCDEIFEHYRHVFNHIRPHEALNMHRPIEIITDPALHPVHNIQKKESVPQA
jgi:transposase InsO family protein